MSTGEESPIETPVTGRPRDPSVDARISDAALRTFADRGWSGFSIDAVARAAGVGKASVYLRWKDREDLLSQVLGTAFAPIAEIDHGDMRSDLVALTRLLLDLYDGPHALAARRISVEAEVVPALAARWAPVRSAQVSATRSIIRRAVDRGELPTHAPVSFIADTLCGATMLRPLAVPAELRERAAHARTRYADELVDFVLRAALSHPTPHPATSGGTP